MREGDKLVVVLANTFSTFIFWGNEQRLTRVNSNTFQRLDGYTGIRYEYKLVRDPIHLMGMNAVGIVLLYGWDHQYREEKLEMFRILFCSGSKIIGERRDISDEDWLMFQRAQNCHALMYHEIDQSWLFDSIDNRFELMEV